MTLRLKLTLLLAAMIVLFTVAQFAFHIRDTRASVHEETLAANMVATHLLGNLMQVFAGGNEAMIVPTLRNIGRVRSNELRLVDHQGEELYRSPPSPYKAGREAPDWYAGLVRPALERTELVFATSTLVIEADPDRSVLDGWDQAMVLFEVALVATVLGILVLWLVVRQATRPFERVVDGLRQMQLGHYAFRLPAAGGAEARAMTEAFNHMAESVQATDAARREAAEARLRLEQSRELAEAVESRIDAERRYIARELHDESAQGLTAIRSLVRAMVRDDSSLDDGSRRALGLIGDTATRLYDSLHALVRRLRPIDLEQMELADSLRERVLQWRSAYPDLRFDLDIARLPADLGERHALAVYRIVQEAVTNALRHGSPRRVEVSVGRAGDELWLRIDDDGVGLAGDWQEHAQFGVRGMQERAEMLGGRLDIGSGRLGGVGVLARLPIAGDGAARDG